MLILTILSLIYKSKTNRIIETTSAYLIEHPLFGIIMAGILWAIILGVTVSVSWEIIWFLSIFPCLFIVFAFPLNLANKKIREKRLLSPPVLRWTGIISISAIFVSVLFIILTNYGILRGTDAIYFTLADNNHRTHPYDSMKEIWSMPFFFMVEVVVTIILFGLGKIYRYLRGALSVVKQKNECNLSE